MALPSHTYQHLDHNNLNLVPDLPHSDESNISLQEHLASMGGPCLATCWDDFGRVGQVLPMDGAENAVRPHMAWTRKAGIEWIMRSICAQCESPFWARQFLVNHPTG